MEIIVHKFLMKRFPYHVHCFDNVHCIMGFFYYGSTQQCVIAHFLAWSSRKHFLFFFILSEEIRDFTNVPVSGEELQLKILAITHFCSKWKSASLSSVEVNAVVAMTSSLSDGITASCVVVTRCYYHCC